MSHSNRRRRRDDDTGDLNLAPFMNIVAILIPMLLLSVVFLKVGVIDVSSPKITPLEESTQQQPTEDLMLTVGIAKTGFEISTSDRKLEPIEGCPPDGPTVCMRRSEIDVGAKLEEARRAARAGHPSRADALYQEVVSAYDFAGLYSKLRELKAEHPEESTLHLTASPDIPYKLVVRVMDAVRFKRAKRQYASNEAFWSAPKPSSSEAPEMFSKPILAVGK